MSRHDEGGAAALMAAYCDGDQKAFAALYEIVAPRLSRFFSARVEVSRADDLVQQTFLKLHRARAIYVRGADPLSWIFTIAHRVLIDDVRARARRPQTESREIAVEPTETDCWLRQTLAAAIDRLSARQRAVLLLTHVEGLSLPDAARRLGTTAGAVRVQAFRGRRALRAILS